MCYIYTHTQKKRSGYIQQQKIYIKNYIPTFNSNSINKKIKNKCCIIDFCKYVNLCYCIYIFLLIVRK